MLALDSESLQAKGLHVSSARSFLAELQQEFLDQLIVSAGQVVLMHLRYVNKVGVELVAAAAVPIPVAVPQ